MDTIFKLIQPLLSPECFAMLVLTVIASLVTFFITRFIYYVKAHNEIMKQELILKEQERILKDKDELAFNQKMELLKRKEELLELKESHFQEISSLKTDYEQQISKLQERINFHKSEDSKSGALIA